MQFLGKWQHTRTLGGRDSATVDSPFKVEVISSRRGREGTKMEVGVTIFAKKENQFENR